MIIKTKIKKIFTGGIVLAFASILLSSVAIVNLTQRAQAAYVGNDGKVLHVRLSEQDNVAQLIQSNIDGTSQTVLNQDVGFFAGRYSKGGSKIVAVAAPDYETIGAGKSDMYLLNADGSGLEYLLGFDQGYIINGASFTNNDQNIIFGAAYFDNDSEEGTWGIYSYNIASQQVAQISISPAGYCDFYPIPSPDGSKIAFLRHQDVNDNLESFIRVMNVDGSDNHQLTYTLANNMGNSDTNCSRAGTSMSILYGSFLGGEPSTTLDWSPDGQKIVYESSNDINTGSTMFITTELNTVDMQGNVTNIKTNEYVMDLSIIDSDDSENQPPDVQYKAAIAPQFTPSGKIIYKYMDVTMPFVFNESRWGPDPNSMSGSVNLNIINVDGTADTILLSTPVVNGMMDIFTNYNMPSVQPLPGNNTNNSNNHNNSNNTNTVTLTNPVNKKLIQLSTPENTNITCSTADKEDSLAQQDSDYQYPVGLVNFCFDTNQTDNTITLTFVTDLKPEQVKARKYNSTNNTYVNLPDSSSPTITATTYDNQPALVLSYTITDNGALDLDDTIGSIKDPVGLAITNELAGQLANTGATAISTTALLAIAAVATGVRVVVRRRG